MEQSIFLKSKNMKDLSICVCVNLAKGNRINVDVNGPICYKVLVNLRLCIEEKLSHD